ncbi:MAG: GNAT family N-acetyltransferase [Thermoproteota archaeon]
MLVRMIDELSYSHFNSILRIINDAAQAYEGVIPDDRWEKPYMSKNELRDGLEEGIQFYGWKEDDKILAVMGIQDFEDITLIRHAYVLPEHQGEDIGGKLLEYLIDIAENSTVLVDPWEDADWAISFYHKHGFHQVSSSEKEKLLRKYWDVSEREIETSVVLRLEKGSPSKTVT